MGRHVLIDADVLCYSSAFAAQRNRYIVSVLGGETRAFNNAKDRDAWLKPQKLDPEAYTVEKILDVLDEGLALVICKNKLTALLETLQATSFELHLTGKGNYRNDIATLSPYKGQRAEVEKPVHFQACREWYERQPQATVSSGEEADDTIGIAQAASGYANIIATIDKDLDTVPGRHYNWAKELRYTVSPVLALYRFHLQMLTGDAADNIPGLPGVGPVRAEKILDGCREVPVEGWAAVCRAYTEAGREADMLEVGRLLWIRREVGQVWGEALHLEYVNEAIGGEK